VVSVILDSRTWKVIGVKGFVLEWSHLGALRYVPIALCEMEEILEMYH